MIGERRLTMTYHHRGLQRLEMISLGIVALVVLIGYVLSKL